MSLAAARAIATNVIPLRADASLAPRKFETTCSNCNLRELCLPQGLNDEDLQRVEQIVYARRRLKRGESLFNAGDEFNSIYAVRSGFFKTSVIDNEGREQVTGFSMGGELLGMHGIGSGRYNGTTTALEDSEVCVMPFSLIEDLSWQVRALQRHLHAVLSREIVRDHGVMMLLGSMRAEERLAAFLLNLSKRFIKRGYSPGRRAVNRAQHVEAAAFGELEIEHDEIRMLGEDVLDRFACAARVPDRARAIDRGE